MGKIIFLAFYLEKVYIVSQDMVIERRSPIRWASDIRHTEVMLPKIGFLAPAAYGLGATAGVWELLRDDPNPVSRFFYDTTRFGITIAGAGLIVAVGGLTGTLLGGSESATLLTLLGIGTSIGGTAVSLLPEFISAGTGIVVGTVSTPISILYGIGRKLFQIGKDTRTHIARSRIAYRR